VRELGAPGAIDKPSGLFFADDELYVTDNATSLVHVFDPDGKPLASYDTGLPAGSLAGITLGPDGLVYLADLKTGAVQRFELP
jgi:DNA-binding beta-propeller fold protein YncE